MISVSARMLNPVSRGDLGDVNLRAEYDQRGVIQKVVDLVMSLVRQVMYSIAFWYHRCYSEGVECGSQVIWKEGSEGLFVFLHGLRADPVAWRSQMALLEGKQYDVFAPVVPSRGMCSLDAAAEPVWNHVEDYVKAHPGKPVCLCGVSNGSRVAMWIDVKLRKYGNTPVKVSTIAGVHFGSSRMDLLNWLGIAPWMYPADLLSELTYESERSKALMEQVRGDLGERVRSYEFFATTEDQSVPDLSSSIPHTGHGQTFRILHGHSHDSIVPAVAEVQMKEGLEWMSRNSVRN